jgi:hypothetical protein
MSTLELFSGSIKLIKESKVSIIDFNKKREKNEEAVYSLNNRLLK